MAFCAFGRRSHDEGLSIAGIAETAWPFLTGAGVGWLLARGWRRPVSLTPTGVAVWLCTVVVGMMLRKATWLYDNGKPCWREANTAKYLCADAGFAADRPRDTQAAPSC